MRWDCRDLVLIVTVCQDEFFFFNYLSIIYGNTLHQQVLSCLLNTSISSSPHSPDHKGPEAVDYRWRDAANRLMHSHLLADCGSTQKDCGRIQLGGACSFDLFLIFFGVMSNLHKNSELEESW